jgi:hypothetical protein
MSEKKGQGLRFLKRLGLVVLIFFIILIVVALIVPDKDEENSEQAQQQSQIQQEMQTVILNSCKLDEVNADYWQGKQVNFWNSAARESVSFTLPACDDLELEIVDSQEVDGNEVYKVRYQSKEGWISKIQLFK